MDKSPLGEVSWCFVPKSLQIRVTWVLEPLGMYKRVVGDLITTAASWKPLLMKKDMQLRANGSEGLSYFQVSQWRIFVI